jgi:hypothetical protein
VSNWDERAAHVKAEAERKEREAEAARRAEEASWDEPWNKLVDVASWALKRYQAAGTEPVSVEAFWRETVKLRRGKTQEEKHSSRLMAAFPLFLFTHYEPGDYDHDYHRNRLLLVSPDINFYFHQFGSGYNPAVPRRIEFEGRTLQDAHYLIIQRVVRSEGKTLLEGIAAQLGHSGVDAGCDQIAAFVAGFSEKASRR